MDDVCTAFQPNWASKVIEADRLTQFEQCQMALNTVRFERELQNAFGKTAQILEAEGARAKRVEQLFLQFEIDDLRLQLGHANVKLNKSLKAESDARRQLHAACDELDRLRSSVRTSSNEMEGLEVRSILPPRLLNMCMIDSP